MTRKQTPATQIEWFLAGCQRIPINGQHWFGHWKKKSPTNKQFWPRNGPIWGQFLGRSFAKWFESGAGAKRAKEHLKCFRPDMFKRRLGHKRQCEGCTIENSDHKCCWTGGGLTMHIGLFLLLGENSMLVIILLWPDVLSLPQSLDTVKAHRQLEVSYDENIWVMMKIYELWWKYIGFDENIWAMMKIYMRYDEKISLMMLTKRLCLRSSNRHHSHSKDRNLN